MQLRHARGSAGHRATWVARRLATASATAMAMAGCQSMASAPQLSPPSSGPPGSGPSGPIGVCLEGPPCETDAGLVAPFQPKLGAATTAAVAPPPISGGTLLALSEGGTAVASDPDRDAIYVVDLASATLTATIALQAGDEPGRLVEDGAGRVHVALRSGGALVTIDPVAGAIVARRNVCPAPRGVAWDSTADLVWVACATGELVALPSSPATADDGGSTDDGGTAGNGSAAVQSFVLQRDLRDVLVESDGTLVVSVFRDAELLRVARDGTVMRTDSMPSLNTSAPQVAWRTVPLPGTQGATVTVHQEQATTSVPTHVVGGYGSASGSQTVSSGAVTVVGATGDVLTTELMPAVLPVDVALSPDGQVAVVAAAGNGYVPNLPDLLVLALNGNDPTGGVYGSPDPSLEGFGASPVFEPAEPDGGVFGVTEPDGGFLGAEPIQTNEVIFGTTSTAVAKLPTNGGEQAIAVAFDPSSELLVQTREPATLRILDATHTAWRTVSLSSDSRSDTGHAIFHSAAGAIIACASCHPEGADDGHVWLLDDEQRRTPSLRGTIAGTAPYHWPGDEPDMPTLIQDVYTGRMGGAPLDPDLSGRLGAWVEEIPAPPAPSWVDPAAATRGQALFASSTTGCSTCHSGAKFTDNATVDVGTGGAFQVPPLIGVGWRTPLLHDGCAATIADRFGACATAGHGSTQSLSSDQISDLTAYLETL
jgi:cytochrome c553